MFTQTEVTKHANKNNSDHSILFEAMKLVFHMKESAQLDLIKDTVKLISKYIGLKEPNIKFTALDILSKASAYHLAQYTDQMKENLQTLLKCL